MRKAGLTLALLLIGFCAAVGQPDLKALDAYYEQALHAWQVPGMSIAIVKDGKTIFSKGYGVREAGEKERPDTNTLYAIASNTKAFTSAAIARLVDEGRLAWDDPVRNYIPHFSLFDDPWISAHTTVRDLLCHRVGLGTFSGDVLWYRSTLSVDDIIRRVAHLPQAYPFRSGYGYSNVMYLTAGRIVEIVSGMRWHDYIRRHFFEPLGMKRSVTSVRELQSRDNYATPHKLVDDRHVPMPWEEWETIAAMGGIISSVDEMARWMIFNLQHGVWQGDTLLSREARNTLWQPHNTYGVDYAAGARDTHVRGYALGWGISDYHGRYRVSHTGGYSGMLSMVTLIPDENLGVVILTNGMKRIFHPLMNYTLDVFLGLPERDWSGEALERQQNRRDTRIEDRRKARVPNTHPTLPAVAYAGVYYTPTYGNIEVTEADGALRIAFEHTPDLAASLVHWHQDVWQLRWDHPDRLAWFSFGTVQFDLDNNAAVSGIRFDVPNDDLWFEELNARKVE